MPLFYIQKRYRSSAMMKTLTKLTIPLVASQIASFGIMTADIIMMGRLSVFDLAAGSLAIRYYQPFYFFALGLMAVIAPLIAQAIGSGDPQAARRTFRQGLVIALAIGFMTMPLVIYGAPILSLLGQGEDVAGHAVDFLFWTGLSMPMFFLFMIFRFFVIGNQKTGAQLIVTLTGLIVNIILNPLLALGGFGIAPMGLSGVAIATLISYGVMNVMMAAYVQFHPDFRNFEPFVRLWRLDMGLMRRIIRLGIPNAIIVMSETGMFVIAGFMIGTFGTAALASAGIANQIAAMAFMVPLGLSQATASVVGRAAGEKDALQVGTAGWSAHILGLIIALPMTAFLLLYPEMLANIFIKPDDINYQETLPIVVSMLFFIGLFQVFDGMQIIASAKLRGINDTKVPALIAVISYWGVGVGSAYILSFMLGFGPAVIWGGLGIGLAAASLVTTLRWANHLDQIGKGRPILIG
ncbi:MAG: MATE family efflux transporter [Candidatus Puniceispirillaceae bacterium]